MKLQFNKIDCFKSLLSKCLQQLLIYKHRRKSRRALLKLDERMLNDIGLNKDQAYKEGKKPFWEGGSSVFDTNEYSRPTKSLVPRKPYKSGGVSLF